MTQAKMTTTEPVNPVSPIDPKPILEHGESPTSIILSIAVLLVLVRNSGR